MFEQLFSSQSACRRHRGAPFADERERYLQHCAEQGATGGTLRMKAKELLWLAQNLESNARDGVDMGDLKEIVRKRQTICPGSDDGAAIDRYCPSLAKIYWLVACSRRSVPISE